MLYLPSKGRERNDVVLLSNGVNYHLHHGDCVEFMATLDGPAFDFAVFSPPFPSLYAYTSEEADIGNSEDFSGDARLHLSFFYRQLIRVMKPGRVVIVHVAQIPRMKRAGGQGLFDFRGFNIRLAERFGFVFEYDWCVRKNPQSQAIRTRSRELQFSGLESDRTKSRGAIPDYLLKFRAPGDNAVSVDNDGEVSRNDWIKWAEPCWGDIRETDTLNVRGTKGEDDTKHICVARGSLVLTREGHKSIEDVKVGDMVLTHKGRWRPVVAKRCNGVKPVVQVEAQGVSYLLVTPDHRLWTRRFIGPGGKGRPPGTSACSHRRNAVRATPEWMGAQHTKSSYVNLQLPPIEDSSYTSEEWWLVGRWLGDGHFDTRGGAHVTCSRQETGGLSARLGNRAGFVHHTQTADQIRIRDAGGRIRALLRQCGSGCSGKRLPVEALALDREHSESLLSGYLSADGSFVERYQRSTASSVSRSLLLGMAMVAQRARGVVASVYAGRPAGECIIEGRRMQTQQDWILSVPPRNLSGFLADDGAWKKVRQVEAWGDAEVWDIQVEEDESFTVEGCVVHNCPLQLGVIDRLVRLYTNPGEVVFSPFAGIGSEGYVSLKRGRRFVGCELKAEYHSAALANLETARRSMAESSASIFDYCEEPS